MNFEHENSDLSKFALAFAQALLRGDDEDAREFLSNDVHDDIQPSDLRKQYLQMISYWSKPVAAVEVAHVDPSGASWAGKEDRDIGWVYLNVTPQPDDQTATLEMICVRIVHEHGRHRIAQIVWGRP